MGGAASGSEEVIPGIAGRSVLLNRVLYRLLGEVVLELEGDERQAVDEKYQVQGEARVPGAVVDLPGHGEAVLRVEGCGCLVAWAGSAVEEAYGVLTMLDALSEDVDDAVVRYLPLETVEELAAGVVVGVQAEGLGGLRLGVLQEGGQVGQVHAGRGVVVLVLLWEPARLQEQVDRAGFESLLAGVGGHVASLGRSLSER